MPELPALSLEEATRIAPLVGIGGKSGDTVIGLTALRRCGPLAYIFTAPRLSAGTLRELSARRREGTVFYQVEDWESLAGVLGRSDTSVLGIKAGSLAEGIGRLLQSSGAGE